MSKRKKRKYKLNQKGKILVTTIISIIICLVAYLIIDPFNTRVKKEIEPEPVEEKRIVIDNPNEEVKDERRMSIVMVGDALIHGAVYLDAAKGNGKYDFNSMFTYLGPIIQNYDLRYYNQESIIGGKKLGISSYPTFNSPDEQADALVKQGFNLVGLANNHSFDKGEAGLKYSIKYWKKQPVVTAGQYASKKERDAVPVFEQNGIKYAFLAYTMCTNGLSAPAGKEYYVNVYSKSLVKKDVAKAKANGAEVIMVAMHWGVEYTHVPNSVQKSTAKYLSSLGVNLIIGAHPHVIQPIEYVNDTLVIYSLGNLISAQRVLGTEKVIGLLAGTDIVVDNYGKVTFDNTNFELLYTYYTAANKNFKVIPFSKLTNAKLNNYASINKKYRKIVDPKGRYNGNKK